MSIPKHTSGPWRLLDIADASLRVLIGIAIIINGVRADSLLTFAVCVGVAFYLFDSIDRTRRRRQPVYIVYAERRDSE